MQARSIIGLVFLLAGTVPLRAQGILDFIPADAMFAAVIRNADELRKKGDKLGEDSGLRPIYRPSQLLPLAYVVMGINGASVDETKPFAIVCVNPKVVDEKAENTPIECLTVAFPVKDVAVMAQNFGLKKEDLQSGKIVEAKKDVGLLGRHQAYCVLKGHHCYLGFHKKALEQVTTTKGLSGELKLNQRKLLGDSDGLLHLGTEAWGDMWKRFIRDTEKQLDVGQEDEEKKAAKEFLEALGSVRFGMMAFRLDGGLGFSFLSVFPREGNEAARKFLSAVRGGDGPSSLTGLPEGHAVAVQASKGDGTKNRQIARMFFRIAVQRFLEPGNFFGEGHRSSLMNVFGEVWQRLQGSRLALYRMADPAELGAFSLVAILDTEDAGKFLAELRQLAKLGSAEGIDLKTDAGKKANAAEIEKLVSDLGHRRFSVRDSAQYKLELAGEAVLPYLEKALKSTDIEVSRRAERIKREIVKAAEARQKELLSGELTRSLKPSFAFLDRTEKAEGQEVKLIAVKLSKQDAAAAPQLAKLFGPDWNKVRVATVNEKVVILVGSDFGLFKAALRNLQDSKPGLASSIRLIDQARKTDPGRKVELHFSAEAAMGIMAGDVLPKPGKLGPPLSSVTLSVEPDRVQADIWMPPAEIKVLLKSFGF